MQVSIQFHKMSYFDQALQKDIHKEYLEAVELYEESVKRREAVSAFINLSFLYWQISLEFAFRDCYNIPDKWASIGMDRYEALLDEAVNLYPKSAEVYFWKRYFSHIWMGEELSIEDVLQILESSSENKLIPYFFLYLHDNDRYQNYMKEIIALAEKEPIAKHLYILSVLGHSI